jgi:hypothetical protein
MTDMPDRRTETKTQKEQRLLLKELSTKLDQHSEMLKAEPEAHNNIMSHVDSIMSQVKANQKCSKELNVRFNEFETKLEPLIKAIDGLVILGEIGNSGAIQGLKRLIMFIGVLITGAIAAWYSFVKIGGD